MNKLTVIFDDKIIIKDGVLLEFAEYHSDLFDAVVKSEGDEQAHALQWQDGVGNLEFENGLMDKPVTESKMKSYSDLFDQGVSADLQRMKDSYLSIDPQIEAREIRLSLIEETDWWAFQDRVMTQEQKDYRQALRDLPETDNWNPVLAWDDEAREGYVTGVNWPVKPN